MTEKMDETGVHPRFIHFFRIYYSVAGQIPL
jgi:hypothetical protein